MSRSGRLVGVARDAGIQSQRRKAAHRVRAGTHDGDARSLRAR